MKRRSAKADGSAPGGPCHRAPMESDYFSKLSALVAHMAVNRYEDGSPRQVGWITIKSNGAGWSVQVKEPDEALSFGVTADTLDNALMMADTLLGTDEAPWDHDAFLAKLKPKVNKRQVDKPKSE